MLDPVAVFSRRLDLSVLKGKSDGMVRCPFHDDSTASLSVDLARGLFHCFGCHAEGGLKHFLRLCGEEIGDRDSRDRSPWEIAYQMATRQAWFTHMAAFLQADVIRTHHQKARELRRYAMYGQDLDDTLRWQLLADAVWFETEAHRLEAIN